MSKQSQEGAGGRQAGAPAQPPATAGGDAESSNTASHGYGKRDTGYRLLRVGVDSLYLSYYGELHPSIEAELGQLKYLAQSRREDEKALAQWSFESHVFEVSDRGQQGFAYLLQDASYRICLRATQGGKLPAAYVKVSSELLAHQPIPEIAKELGRLMEALGEIEVFPVVGRVDVFADFQTDTDIGAIPREAWVTQAIGIDAYSRKGKFTGWVFGAGSDISGRLYDKTAEIEKSGKTFFHELWQRSGWDVQSAVWRMEFQFRREVLRAFRLNSLQRITDNLGGLWLAAVESWLRLTVPDPNDSNRARWPLHPTWQRLSEIRWRLDDVPLTRSYTPARVPSSERLYRLFMALLTSFMAAQGFRVYGEAVVRLMERAREWHEGWCRDRLQIDFDSWLDQKVSVKARQFNTRRKAQSLSQEAKTSDKVEKDASDYYRKSRGE